MAGELLVGDVCRQVGVKHGAEGQAVVPAAAEVRYIDVLRNTAKTHSHWDLTRQDIYSRPQQSMEN